MADNTIQFRLIVTIKGGINALFLDNPNVFVAGDLFWYSVEGEPWLRQATLDDRKGTGYLIGQDIIDGSKSAKNR